MSKKNQAIKIVVLNLLLDTMKKVFFNLGAINCDRGAKRP